MSHLHHMCVLQCTRCVAKLGTLTHGEGQGTCMGCLAVCAIQMLLESVYLVVVQSTCCLAKPLPCLAKPLHCLAKPLPCLAKPLHCLALPSQCLALPCPAKPVPFLALPCQASALPCLAKPMPCLALPMPCLAKPMSFESCLAQPVNCNVCSKTLKMPREANGSKQQCHALNTTKGLISVQSLPCEICELHSLSCTRLMA